MSDQNRNRYGLYPELFERAFREHAQLPVRSENQGKLSGLFVDNHHLGLVQKSDWQVIYGRRGTGKTMLLGVLRERLDADFEKSRVLPVSLTAQDFLVSPPNSKATDRQRSRAYFEIFLEAVAEQIVHRADEVLGNPTFLEKITGTRKRLADKIQERAIEILLLVQTGLNVEAYATKREVREQTNSDMTEVDSELAAGASVSPKNGTLMAKVSAKMRTKAARSTKTKLNEDMARVPRFALARAKIVELLSLLQVKRLDILIDEWQTLDPHASTGIQPEFAEYLKRTFFGAPQISVKIATNRYQTRFSNKGAAGEYRGLEVGADIFEATNLDRTEQSLGDQIEFYGALLLKRLIHCEPELSVFNSENHDILSQFILSMFRDAAAFEELVKGASATPRDFLLLFNSLAKTRGYSNRPTWSVAHVHEAIRQGGANLQEETDPASEADQLLTRCIRSVVVSSGSRLFLVDRDDRVSVHNALEELIEKRLVDSYSRAEVLPDIRLKYDAFLLNYGLWLDWRPPDSVVDPKPEIPKLRAADIRRYTIRIGDIDSDTKVCPHCGDHFSAKTRSYQIRKLCPQCFKSADEPLDVDSVPTATAPKKRAARKVVTKKRDEVSQDKPPK